MKNKELYEKSVNVLLDAYNNGTLFHGNCYACAVGNLIAKGCNIEFIKDNTWKDIKPEWDNVFSSSTVFNEIFQEINLSCYQGETKRQIDSTRYSVEELAKIEYEFENILINKKYSKRYLKHVNPKLGQFLGLVAVLNTLKEIHEIKEEIHTENIERLEVIKEQFITV